MDFERFDKAERDQLYISGMHPLFNKKAVFSDMTKDYVRPAQPAPYSTVQIRIRAAHNNVDRIILICKDNRYQMYKGEQIGEFDYYEYTLELDNEQISYYFEIFAGAVECFYDQRGVVKQQDAQYFFKVIPGFDTPDWAKGAVMYQIFVDRFCNGDKSNDVKLVQTRLTELGYLTSKVTGTFDDDSVKALKKFQKANGLDADGVCGIQTRAVLFAAHPVYAVPTATPVIAANETPEPTYAPITKENCVTIKAGSQGMDVKRLQIRLQELGYYTSRQDGIYLTDDIAAVRAFQKANGLTTDGKAGYNTQTVLYSNAAKRADNANSDVIASSKAATLRYGSQGVEVQTLQNKLISLGYLSGSADGKFGSSTRRAVKAFQQANGLSPDGIVGAATQAKLGDGTTDSGAVSNTVPYVTLYKGATGEAVKAMQNRLIALGYLSGAADGDAGSKTVSAIRSFQSSNGLGADGVAGEKTQRLLFSGSAKRYVKPAKPYLLKIDTSKQRVYAYSYDKATGSYSNLVRTMVCSTGKDATPTPQGTFTSTSPVARWGYFPKYDVWGQYLYRINGSILFHSVLYTDSNENSLIAGSLYKLGSKASHGCVRLSVEDAKWIYTNCPAGTTVKVV